MFTVPIVPADLRHEETIIQAAYALDCLQKTINKIFLQIDERIESNNVKVKEMNERIQKAQTKVKGLLGAQKALHIYAPSKFPSTQAFQNIPLTFDSELWTDMSKKDDEELAQNYKVESKMDPCTMSMSEKLLFFHVLSTGNDTSSNLKAQRMKVNQTQGLGKVSGNLRSVPSVLLFNTDIRVYDSDNTHEKRNNYLKCAQGVHGQHQQLQHGNQKHILEPAPHSLAHRNEKFSPAGMLRYTPRLSEAPKLDLPIDLPDLPGIAGDLRYENQEGKQLIAPSSTFVAENTPEISEILSQDIKAETDEKNDKDQESNLLSTTNQKVDILYESFTTPPPPPPPPISPPFAIQPATSSTKIDLSLPSNKPRTELLEAIRQAGGIGKARLRSTAATPLRKTVGEVKQSSNPHASDSFMADLHNKLLMRRKGISGSNKDEESTVSLLKQPTQSAYKNPYGNPVISRLSSLIPPPKDSEDDDEDKYDDDTDWID
uniref:WH2 domain-containing protein n=1 Tax=Glossina brevipalpis TaxID=37001 RepID=A0A1A9WWP7_9MUSC